MALTLLWVEPYYKTVCTKFWPTLLQNDNCCLNNFSDCKTPGVDQVESKPQNNTPSTSVSHSSTSQDLSLHFGPQDSPEQQRTCHLCNKMFPSRWGGESRTGFLQILEILESPWISRNNFPGLESPGILMKVLESPGNLSWATFFS